MHHTSYASISIHHNQQYSMSNDPLETHAIATDQVDLADTPHEEANLSLLPLHTINTKHHDSNYTPSRLSLLKGLSFKSLLLGQVISWIVCSMNASAFTLAQSLRLQTRFFQMISVYFILLLQFYYKSPTTSAGYAYPFGIRLHWPIYKYIVITILDVLPNSLVLWSFQYTSLTSTTLLGSLSVPSVMVFSKCILARRFGLRHYCGVALCLIGASLLVVHDSESARFDRAYLGDLLALSAALVYGLGDTLAEYMVKQVDRGEYLGMLGLFGMCVSITGSLVFERDQVASAVSGLDTRQITMFILACMWFAVSNAGYYILGSIFLIQADATLLNLSVQTANLWAALFGWLVYHWAPPPVYFVSVVCVVTGVVLYEYKQSIDNVMVHDEDGVLDESDAMIDQESASTSPSESTHRFEQSMHCNESRPSLT
jgi:solute carrier family 35, member F1/2